MGRLSSRKPSDWLQATILIFEWRKVLLGLRRTKVNIRDYCERMLRLGLLLLCLTASPGIAQATPETEIKRLYVAQMMSTARLWNVVKFQHPYLAYKEIDWDGALLASLPAIRGATDENEFLLAIERMLSALDDTSTYVERAKSLVASSPIVGSLSDTSVTRPAALFKKRDGAVVINCATAIGVSSHWRQMLWVRKDLAEALSGADHIVLDCRAQSNEQSRSAPFSRFIESALSELVHGSYVSSTLRFRAHQGYESQTPAGSTIYFSSVEERVPRRFVGNARSGTSKKRLAVILDHAPGSVFFTLAGLQIAGHVSIVEARNGPSIETLIASTEVPLTGAATAFVRTAEILNADGTSGFEPDAIVWSDPVKPYDEAQITAVKVLRGTLDHRKVVQATTLRHVLPQRDEAFVGLNVADENLRLLTLFRFWGIVELFYPYKDLLDKPLDSTMARFLPLFESIISALDYERAILMLASALNDSHATVSYTPAFFESLGGPFVPPIALRRINDEVVVIGINGTFDGLSVGSIVEEIDGEQLSNRLDRFAPLVSESSPQGFRRPMSRVFWFALAGARNSVAMLGVRDAGQGKRNVMIPRTIPFGWTPERTTPVYGMLRTGIGYIDAIRLQPSDINLAIDELWSSKAMILDMRGYPGEAGASIATRLSSKDVPSLAARNNWPLIAPFFERLSVEYRTTVAPSDTPRYEGELFVLINEDTISQAEHICLKLKAGARSVTFVGSPTVGANGNISHMLLPGNYLMAFSGLSVVYPDGTELQRRGIQPDVVAYPTVGGIQNGRDEALEAALSAAKSVTSPAASTDKK